MSTGARETDYPMGDEIPKQEGEQGNGARAATATSTEGASEDGASGTQEGLQDGLRVVGCSGEGAVAIPQTVCGSALTRDVDADTGKTAGPCITDSWLQLIVL